MGHDRTVYAIEGMMQTSTQEIPREFHSVQYLRGIAAIAVVYFHTKIYLGEFNWPFGRQFGYGGVDLFFAISGFIMMVTTATKPETPGSFYAKRIVRVVPLYWGATLTSAVLFLAVPTIFIKQTMTFEHVLLSMLFIPHVDPESGASPFFKIGWTLYFEMFFYLVFGLALLLKSAWFRLAAIAVFFIGMVLVGVVFPTNTALGYYTSPFLLEFLMGAVVGFLAWKGALRHLPMTIVWAGSVLALGCVLVIGGRQGDGFARILIFGLPAACLLAFGIAAELQGKIPKIGALEKLGNASYSIYLAHPFVLTGTKALAKALQVSTSSPITGVVVVIFAVTAAAIFGIAVYSWIEKPMLRLMRGLLQSAHTRFVRGHMNAVDPLLTTSTK